MQIIIYAYILTEPMKHWININCVRNFNAFRQLLGGQWFKDVHRILFYEKQKLLKIFTGITYVKSSKQQKRFLPRWLGSQKKTHHAQIHPPAVRNTWKP